VSGSLSGRAIAARLSEPVLIEEGEGFRFLFCGGAYVLERMAFGRWREVERGRWLFDVLGVEFCDRARVESPAAVALPFSSRVLDRDARRYRGERRPPGWSLGPGGAEAMR